MMTATVPTVAAVSTILKDAWLHETGDYPTPGTAVDRVKRRDLSARAIDGAPIENDPGEDA